jgi:hypothetical protein
LAISYKHIHESTSAHVFRLDKSSNKVDNWARDLLAISYKNIHASTCADVFQLDKSSNKVDNWAGKWENNTDKCALETF